MIEKIDIDSFGSYSCFQHDKNIDSKYKKLNICYGKNYSGKSTFSRIFRSFEMKELPEKYDEIRFSIQLSSGEVINEESVRSEKIKTKVFNSDYIRENLNFFSDDGISSFALLGKNNIMLEEKIATLENEKEELIIKKNKIDEQYRTSENELNLKNRQWEQTKTSIASVVRQDNNMIIGHYDKRNLVEEIEGALESIDLSSEDIVEYKKSIIEEEKEIQNKIIFPKLDYVDLQNRTNYLLKKTVTPSRIIEELENNFQKQQWVKDGLSLHRESNICLFCGNSIEKDRYEILDQTFSKETKEFEKELSTFSEHLNYIKNTILSMEEIEKNNFYVKFQKDVESINEVIMNERNKVLLFLEGLIADVERKKTTFFDVINNNILSVPSGFYKSENSIYNRYNSLYEKNKKMTELLEENKEQARKALRFDFIKKNLKQIDYAIIQKDLTEMKANYCAKKKEKDTIINQIKEISVECDKLKVQLSNEKIAAEQINSYLNSELGHEELRLDVKENSEKQNCFAVYREGRIAYNLSEGEMSLISFAYYLATLKELTTSEIESTIIFIDDPISSLDENNIFYIYSLIYSEIIEKNYNQIFLTTHNLDFLKYATKYKISNKQKLYLMINKYRGKEGDWKSFIQNMPKYMSNKVTEFNFLFEQIYTVATENQTDDNFYVFYNFPNNARKFLETLLFFKYPSYKDPESDSAWKYKEFFGKGVNEPFINRINNEYSHGLDRFDRLTKQINSTEFKKDALLILKTIKEKDRQQYESFLRNSNLTDLIALENI